MDGVLVKNTINASIDIASRSGNVHQYFIKNLLIIITILITIYLFIMQCIGRVAELWHQGLPRRTA